ncbi:uncharacterized protein LOC132760123 [Ruditapes philippinarum]|uniref:uncharacterized protein LOC132760123 n=1 Tax=Ruditapes philippinarum TaxID=129788 RepID=UPI00295C00FC|nr:uncharacterized protein LOC132760123 [Ruditapes philippinarum]
MFANPPSMHWVVLFFCLARLSRADYSCLCNYQVELPIFSVMDTTSTPVGYMYEFDCKPVAKVNYATDGFNVIMNEHKIAFVEKSSSVLSQVCQGNIPSEDKVTALPGQNNTSSFRPIVSEATTVTTTTTTTTATTTPVAVTTTPPTTATTTKTTTTSKVSTATTSTDTTTTPKTTTTTSTFIKLSSATAGLTLPPSSYLTRLSTTNMPTTSTTTRQTTAKSNFNLAQIPDSSNISLCPPALTTATDGRWIRQYKTFCYEIVSGRYEDWYDALQDCNVRHGDNVGGTLLRYIPLIYNNT